MSRRQATGQGLMTVEYQVMDPAALTNETLGVLHQQGYAADARLIVFVRHTEARGVRREASGDGATPEDTDAPADQTPGA